jgi:ketosteroid isomerase-like protein
MRRLLFLSSLFLLCLPVLAEDDEAKIKITLEGRYKEWISAANKRDAAALTDLFDENAVLLPKQEEPVIGKVAIGSYYKKLVANPNFVPFNLELNLNSFHVVNDIAIATAIFDGAVTRNGRQLVFRGKELLVWKKQTDGSWKIFRYMFDEITAKQ